MILQELLSICWNDYQTDENGDQLKIAFSLNTKPMNGKDVTIPVALVENSDEMALLESEITIENENWDDPESNVLILSGLDDFVGRRPGGEFCNWRSTVNRFCL